MERTEKGLTSARRRQLLEAARKVVSDRLNGEKELPDMPEDPVFSRKAATFVTLKISGRLRGCIGTLEPAVSLWQSVCDNAVNAAFRDRRFSPLSRGEMDSVEIDISVLTPSVPLDFQDPADLPQKLQPGTDGVTIREGSRGATFLPQVWQQLPSPEQFLDQLCLKAGLEKTAWRERQLEVSTYRVLCFKEETG
ncbi:MAG: AmmeMemoRadiSam system protein A [Deltaproteobacteria bacterium]|nr:AmmeMemoRadiSam system protein A [Deltaproteobacteria bacterium]MBW2658405.1 AmmeMemoRadiSam system protein A [Deltaproteobacteria bacterium]